MIFLSQLFHFDVHEDVRTIADATIEKDEVSSPPSLPCNTGTIMPQVCSLQTLVVYFVICSLSNLAGCS